MMSSSKFINTLGIACLCVFLWTATPALCQDDDFDLPSSTSEDDGFGSGGDFNSSSAEASSSGGGKVGGLIDPNLDEVEQTNILAEHCKFQTPKQKDPFRPLVQKKVVLPPVVQRPTKPSGPSAPPPPPPPKPIQLFVSGIVGNEGERLAIVNFENKIHTVAKDADVDGKFKVVDILPDRVVIYSNKEQMRRTFAIGGGKE